MIQRWRQSIRNPQWPNERTRDWFGMIVGAAQDTLRPDSVIYAAAIAYFALFSVFPLALLSIAFASYSLGSLMDQHLVVQRLEFIAPALGQLLGQNINDIILERGPITIAALVGLLWSASAIFYMLNRTLNKIWAIKRHQPIWQQRGLAIIVVLALVVPTLFLTSFAGSLVTTLRTLLPDSIIQVASNLSLGLAILLDIALFMVLYLILPHGNSTWRGILPGAIGAGLLWELAKKAFLLFVATYISASNLVYGSVAAIVAFLTWAFLSGHIFLFGAYLNLRYAQSQQPKPEESHD